MKRNKRLTSRTKMILVSCAVILCIVIIWAVSGSNKISESEAPSKDGEAQVIESEGDVEIIIPDDQESGGF